MKKYRILLVLFIFFIFGINSLFSQSIPKDTVFGWFIDSTIGNIGKVTLRPSDTAYEGKKSLYFAYENTSGSAYIAIKKKLSQTFEMPEAYYFGFVKWVLKLADVNNGPVVSISLLFNGQKVASVTQLLGNGYGKTYPQKGWYPYWSNGPFYISSFPFQFNEVRLWFGSGQNVAMLIDELSMIDKAGFSGPEFDSLGYENLIPNGQVKIVLDRFGDEPNVLGAREMSNKSRISNYELNQNYPNPFNPTTNIEFRILNYASTGSAQEVSLKIFDVMGREVKTLVNGPLSPGMHQVVWNGKDNQRNKVTSGTYFYKLSTGNFSQTKKMALLR